MDVLTPRGCAPFSFLFFKFFYGRNIICMYTILLIGRFEFSANRNIIFLLHICISVNLKRIDVMLELFIFRFLTGFRCMSKRQIFIIPTAFTININRMTDLSTGTCFLFELMSSIPFFLGQNITFLPPCADFFVLSTFTTSYENNDNSNNANQSSCRNKQQGIELELSIRAVVICNCI